MERWINIKDYNSYQVSNLGRIRSLDRDIIIKTKNSLFKRRVLSKIIKGNVNSNGYLTVSLSKEGLKKTFNIHKLVAIHFLNDKAEGYEKVVDHIDFNKQNNQINNLQLITNGENLKRSKI